MSEAAAPRLDRAIRAALVPALREDGFAGSGRTFRRTDGAWVHVVHVQGARAGGSFAINRAVHPLAVPDVTGQPPDPGTITESQCEFQRRLCETGTDHWWTYPPTDDGMRSAAGAAAAMYRRTGRALFQRACGAGSGLNTLRAARFSSAAFDVGGFGATRVRMALALARLRQSEGQHDEAGAFAACGLDHAGSAAGLRNALAALVASQ